MIRINRSTDLRNDTVWVTVDHNEETQRCRQLYLGTDINGAMAAAVQSGLPRDEAVAQAVAARDRCQVTDQLVGVN